MNYFTMFATGTFFCVLGFSFIFDSIAVWNWLYTTFVIGVAIIGIIRLCNLIINFRKVDSRLHQTIDIIAWIIAVVISLSYPQTFFMMLPRFVGAWIFITCDCENHCYVDKKTRSSANSCPQCFLFTWRFDYELFPDHFSSQT